MLMTERDINQASVKGRKNEMLMTGGRDINQASVKRRKSDAHDRKGHQSGQCEGKGNEMLITGRDINHDSAKGRGMRCS